MKKKLIALLAVTVVATSSVYAANPVSDWLNKTANSIEKINSDANKASAQAESDKQSFIAKWKAKRAEAKAQRDAKKAAVKNEVKETKNAFQRLFTWDWN